MATAVFHYTATALTDRGRKRASNEDAFGYSAEHGIYLVCDGMGGAAAGEVASSLAVEEVLRRVEECRRAKSENSADGANRGSSVSCIAEDAVAAANEAIHSRSRRNQRLSGMGTTLVGLLTSMSEEDSRAWLFYVGDSRCYLFRKGHLELKTQDHSFVEEQIRLGRLTPAEAARSPFRNIITRALGTQPTVRADVIEVAVEPGDLFLLCSDGLTRELPDARIESILADLPAGEDEGALEDRCRVLIQAANKAGGNDNITCLLVRAD
ncbi:protein phosphatase 2C domain-containing protein [Acidicapsa dinghuensis]|uniref:Protein phosphatase 2C domain-containing protein n=1 Tax=Acidicapsa dinghuensis TaxID=2218256 RepID=A0ABW1EJW5_9BACT|nr:PP2C family serine/threonine-protein phosphatase [Acidicapsa dinghuensis]